MTANQRFPALDVFRGLTICLMIIVNTPGDYSLTFAPFEHAKWHGFTPTDLVFPSFLFAVGNAMSFVMKKWAQKSSAEVVGKILKRTFLIFLLGYLMYWFPFVSFENGSWSLRPFSETRILGVLQRIALCYGIASLLIWFLKPRVTILISAAILLLYWGLCFWVGDPYDPLSLQGNAGLRFDLWLMGESHLYHGEGVAFDPEGLLSTLPAVVNVVAGYVAGQWVQQKGKNYEGLAKLVLAGFALVVIAYFWNFLFPINKKLWTSSFVLHTAGLDCMILGAVIYLVDMQKITRGTYFFEVFGRNPLFIYLLSEILIILLYLIQVLPGTSIQEWIYLNSFRHLGDYWGSLSFAVTYMLLCWCVGYWLQNKTVSPGKYDNMPDFHCIFFS